MTVISMDVATVNYQKLSSMRINTNKPMYGTYRESLNTAILPALQNLFMT